MEENKSFWEKLSWWYYVGFTALVLAIALLIIDLKKKMFEGPKLENIIAEAHGFLFDLVFLVIGLGIYERMRNRKGENKRLLEELDDFKHWKGQESSYRRIGILKRLINNSVKKIQLIDHHFEDARFYNLDYQTLVIRNTTFSGCGFSQGNINASNFRHVTATDCTFDKIKFTGNPHIGWFKKSYFNNCEFHHMDLSAIDFENCRFRSSKFINCDLQFTNLNHSLFHGADFTVCKFDRTDLDGVIFMDLRREELTQKLYEWIGKEKADAQIFARYHIRNFDDPDPWDPSSLLIPGRPLKYIPKKNGCYFVKNYVNPYAVK